MNNIRDVENYKENAGVHWKKLQKSINWHSLYEYKFTQIGIVLYFPKQWLESAVI